MSKESKNVLSILTVAFTAILLVLWLAGCKSLPGKLEIDTPFIDIEYEGKETQ
jgi:starvation-inducible outer membrane lipoprotein